MSDSPLAVTVPEILRERAARTPAAPAIWCRGERGWEGSTWSELLAQVERVAAAFVRLGVRRGDRVAVMAPTSTRWFIVDLALQRVGGVVVGIEPQAPVDRVAEILRRAEARGLVADTPLRLAPISEGSGAELSFLASLGAGAEGVVGWAALDTPSALDLPCPSPSDDALMVFTSGTTGAPRALKYTHGQLLAALGALRRSLQELGPDDRMIAWLPMAVLFQRVANLVMMAAGGATYFVDDPRTIMSVVAELHPTFFIGVPRFYEKLLASGQTPLMGSRLRYALTGSAPIAPSILSELHRRGVLVLEAYGLSENIIPMAISSLTAHRFGSVGRPPVENEIRRAEDGELLVRGPGVFDGYLDAPDSRSCFTEDGFYRTGDIGHFDEDGFLHLDGRKVDLIKTSTGHRISPSRVESVYAGIGCIDQLVVLGDGRPFLVGLVVLSPRIVAAELDLPGDTAPADLAASAAVRAHVAGAMARVEGALTPYERVRDFAILPEPFSVAAGEVTSGQKLRRAQIARRHGAVVETLYRSELPCA